MLADERVETATRDGSPEEVTMPGSHPATATHSTHRAGGFRQGSSMTIKMVSVPADGSATEEMMSNGLAQMERVMEKASKDKALGQDALVLLGAMAMYRGFIEAAAEVTDWGH
jgi:hypothetical protein